MNNRQIVFSPEPGILLWDAEPGHSGYKATYQMLVAQDDYIISYYCAPLDPTTKSWTSVVVYSRSPLFPPPAKDAFLSILSDLKWDNPPKFVNQNNCTYILPPLPPKLGEDGEVAVEL